MSREDVKRLVERMDTDEVFRETMLAAPDVAARLVLAAAEGYDVTREELVSEGAALSDAELGRVVGGGAMQGVGDSSSDPKGKEEMPPCCCWL